MGKFFTLRNALLPIILFVCAVPVSGFGQIADWNNTSLSGTTTTGLYATAKDANLDSAVLSRGAGITATSLSGGYASSNWVDASEANAITNNRYYQCIISAKANFKVSLSALDAKLRRSGTGPNTYIWRYSTNGTGFTDIGSPVSFTTTTTGGDVQPQINLSAISALQNVTAGTVITLRLYAWGATGSGGTLAFGTGNVNSLALSGSVVTAALSSNANLSGLIISSATLAPSFSSAITDYTASLPNSVSSITVTATASDASATIKANGTGVASGTASAPIALSVGDNTISTQVTAENGSTKTYTVLVTRAAAGTPSIITNSGLPDFGNVCTATTAGPNSFTFSGSDLDGTNISIGALPGYSYSETAAGYYTNTLNISYTGSDLSGKVIYVTFSPTSVQSYSGDIVISGGGVSGYAIPAKGLGVNTSAAVTTGSSLAVTATTATVTGSVSQGCSPVTAYGFEYSANTGFADGSGTVVSSSNLSGTTFSATITGLAPNTRYYYKAFATTAAGTTYGNQQAFTNTPLPVAMASEEELTYTQDFSDIADWTNFFVAGNGANHFGGLSAAGSGGIPNGSTVTASTNSFQGATFGSSGGVQKGTDQSAPTQSIVLLSTGSSDNSTAAAIDFYMDFTGVNAGTLSFDWASVNNSTGDRKGSLRVYASAYGSTFTEIPSAAVLNFTNNNPTSGSISNIQLPVSFNNNPNARLRFYYSNGTGGTTGSRPKISIDNLTVTAVPNTPCATPSTQPTTMVFGEKTDVSIHGSFSPASPTSDQYLTVVSNNSTLSSDPVDGVIYNVGDAFGDGTVIAKGSSNSFTATNLSPSTNYYFFTYSVNGVCTGGPKYLTVNPLVGNAATNAALPSCAAPASQPTNLVLENAGVNKIDGSFTATTADAYLVLQSTASALSATPVNGQSYNPGDAIGNAFVIQANVGTSFTANNLKAGTQYYFYVIGYNAENCVNGPNYNTSGPLTGTQTTQPLPPCASPAAQPTLLSLTAGNTVISGTFNPSNTADGYLVVRSTSSTLSATPVDNTDYAVGSSLGGGTVVANTTATSFISDNANPATTYYFFVFAANSNCSGGTKYLVGSPLTGTATTTSIAAKNYYFGTFHAHSYYSDGNKDNPNYAPKDDYDYAKTALKMDFLGISEHNHFSSAHNPGNSITNFHKGFVQADSVTSANPNFLAMYGMEWGVISGGGHVVIYGDGMDKLFGWESGSGQWGPSDNYDVYVPKSVYTGPNGLFKTVNDYKANNTFATLAHPNPNDYNNLANVAYDAVADSAITGSAVESGPAFSTNKNYSDPAPAMSYLWYYQTMLAKGYHLGPTIDHDNHNTTFGHTAFSRTAVIAPALTKTEIVKAMRSMHFYATEDGDSKVDFTINTRMMGSQFSDRNAPAISVTLSDATSNTSAAIIRIMYGMPGSGAMPIKIDSVIGNRLSYVDNSLPVGATGYYYVDISNGTTRIVTSPIWYTRTCSVTGDTTVYACNSYEWNGQTYSQSGTYTKGGLTTIGGCDSTAILHLTITTPSTGDTTAVACDSLTWYGTTYTTSATANHLFRGLGGCDSTVTLHLTVNHSSSSTTQLTACDSLTWNGDMYTSSGRYTYLTSNATGCDSTAVLVLAINHSTTSSQAQVACDSYVWHDKTYTESGDYIYQSQNEQGCSNTDTLHLTINRSTTTSETASACDSYTWNGNTYAQSGDYTYQSPNAEGCTNTARLHLTINKSTSTNETATACDSYTWNGNTYTKNGDYTYESQNEQGCKNTATLHLTINPKPVVTVPDVYVLAQGVTANTLYTGYASEATFTVKASGGSAGYLYSWTTGSGLAAVSASNQDAIKVSATASGNYSSTLTITVIDAKGCSARTTVTVNVIDVRSGNKNDKVTVCHNGAALSISSNAVPAHLDHGDKLGSCNASITANARSANEIGFSEKAEPGTEAFNVKVSPNPTTSNFKIVVSGKANEPITIRLLDLAGRVMSISNNVQRNETVTLGSNLPGGVYLGEIIQGSNRKIVKLIKQK